MNFKTNPLAQHRDDFQALALGAINYDEIAGYYEYESTARQEGRPELEDLANRIAAGDERAALAYIRDELARQRKTCGNSSEDVIRGLPSWFNAPFTNHDVLQWLYNVGVIEAPSFPDLLQSYDCDQRPEIVDFYQDLIDQWWFKLGATLRQLADDCDGPVLPAYIKRAQRPRAFRVMVNAQEAAHVDGLPSWPVMVFAGAVDDARAKAVEQFTAANPWITSDDQVYPGNTSRIPAGSESAAFIAAGHPLIDNDALNFNQVGE